MQENLPGIISIGIFVVVAIIIVVTTLKNVKGILRGIVHPRPLTTFEQKDYVEVSAECIGVREAHMGRQLFSPVYRYEYNGNTYETDESFGVYYLDTVNNRPKKGERRKLWIEPRKPKNVRLLTLAQRQSLKIIENIKGDTTNIIKVVIGIMFILTIPILLIVITFSVFATLISGGKLGATVNIAGPIALAFLVAMVVSKYIARKSSRSIRNRCTYPTLGRVKKVVFMGTDMFAPIANYFVEAEYEYRGEKITSKCYIMAVDDSSIFGEQIDILVNPSKPIEFYCPAYATENKTGFTYDYDF